MNRTRSGLGAFVLLAILTALCFVEPVPGIAATIIVGLLVAEVDRSGKLIACDLVWLASRLLPPATRNDWADEWSDHVSSAGEAGLRPVLIAIPIVVLAAPRITLRTRIGPGVGEYLLALCCTVARMLGNGRETGARIMIRSLLVALASPGVFFEAVIVSARGAPASRSRILVFATIFDAISGFVFHLPTLPWPTQASVGAVLLSLLPILGVIASIRRAELVVRVATRLRGGEPTKLMPVIEHLRKQIQPVDGE